MPRQPQPREVIVDVPRSFKRWHDKPQATVIIQGDNVTTPDGQVFIVKRLEYGVYAVHTQEFDFKVGTITQQTIKGAVTAEFLGKLNLVRSALMSLPFPAPIAYVMKERRGLLHPGECFAELSKLHVHKVVYTAHDDDRCFHCERPFV